ncbi:hypothetical protein BLOT_007560 [Blomia tropicalis]|nr:hypothetical protein BLOT_007560 [Blomia tropicalis]
MFASKQANHNNNKTDKHCSSGLHNNLSRLQALSAEVSNAGAVSGGEVDQSTLYNRHRRLTSLYSSYGPDAAAIVEARNMASKRKPGPAGPGAPSTGKGPSSLFIFSEDNWVAALAAAAFAVDDG